jgi:hypothetical protein
MMSVRARHLLGVAVFAAALPVSASGAGFPIANTASSESTHSVAFDGTNFLVAINNDGILAQLVSPSGALLGSVQVSDSGDLPRVAFDGANYLLVWVDTETPTPVVGQRVSKQAALVGAPFQVSQSTTVRELDGVAFDGTNYLVVWTDIQPFPMTNRDIYGRFVSAAGAPTGIDFKISDGAGKDATLAFGASRYLVAWTEDVATTETRARFVTPAGALQTPFTVNGSSAPSDNRGSMAFDGTNFLVVWCDEAVGLQSWDIFGQLVSPAAALVGGVLSFATAPGPQLVPFAAFDGLNYLVTWTDGANDANEDFVCDPGEGTCLDVYGQFLSPAGTLVGTNFPVVADPLHQGQSPVAWGGGKYLVAWSERLGDPNEDVFGTFVLSDPIFMDGFE